MAIETICEQCGLLHGLCRCPAADYENQIAELMAGMDQAEARVGELSEALNGIYNCADGIMPIYKDEADLRQTIIAADDARWTRLFAIWATARRALAGDSSAVVDTCEHNWVDARNKIIQDGEWCPKCNAIRAGNEATDGKAG